VADELRTALSVRFPGLSVCGAYTPPFRPLSFEEEAELLGRLQNSTSHLLGRAQYAEAGAIYGSLYWETSDHSDGRGRSGI
jgi:hypothetical protein